MAQIPFDELDPNIRSLVIAMNRFPGIRTVGSCGGHPNPLPYQRPEGTWDVVFDVEKSEAGWRSLEFLAWVAHDMGRGDYDIQVRADSAPPYLNTPGGTLKFVFEGRCDPETVARLMEEWRREHYIPAKEPEREAR